jgi:tetratricopeptide (TPR) repeat protein|nr:tetratricopeptide repeat protein [Kofleriaceae bacterium]
MNKLVVVLAVVAACRKGGDKPSGGSGGGSGGGATAGSGSAAAPAAKGSAAAATTGSAGAGSAAASSAKKPAQATKQQRADYTKHMRAGYAAQKTSSWAAAVPEFEAATVAIPGDQRALTELGYSAMLAGDYAKAKKVDVEALAVTIGDKKVKAMGLYNLGLVQEKLGDKDGALHSFVTSLQLRPNATVEKEVGKLGTKPAADAPFCAAGADPCICVWTDAFGEPGTGSDDDKATCDNDATDIPASLAGYGYRAYHVHELYDDLTYLLDEKNQLVAKIRGEGGHGHFYHTLEVKSADVKTVGGHKVLLLETESDESSTTPAMSEDPRVDAVEEDYTTNSVTVCVLADAKAKTPTRCVLHDVPRSHTYKSYDETDNGSGDMIEKPGPSGETTLDIALADDGTATVKLLKGSLDPSDQPLVGPHKLW